MTFPRTFNKMCEPGSVMEAEKVKERDTEDNLHTEKWEQGRAESVMEAEEVKE